MRRAITVVALIGLCEGALSGPVTAAVPDEDDIPSSHMRIAFTPDQVDTLKALCGVTPFGAWAHDGDMASLYADLLTRVDAYSSTFATAAGQSLPTYEWGSLHDRALHIMMNSMLAWIISGDASYRSKFTGYMQQIVDNAASRQSTFSSTMPTLCFSDDDYVNNNGTSSDPSDDLHYYGWGYAQNQNGGEYGRSAWAPVVWDAVVDSLDAGSGSDQTLADDFGEMVLALFVGAARRADQQSELYRYTEARSYLMAGVCAVAVAGDDRFLGTEVWGSSPPPDNGGLDTDTYDSTLRTELVNEALSYCYNQLEMWSTTYFGGESNGYYRVMTESYWPVLAMHHGTGLNAFAEFPGYAQTPAWWLYATTGSFANGAATGVNESSPFPFRTWAGLGQRADEIPDIALSYSCLSDDPAIDPQVRYVYDLWHAAESDDDHIWYRIISRDAEKTRTAPTPGNTPLVRHFGRIVAPGEKFTTLLDAGWTFARSDWDFSASNGTTNHYTYVTGGKATGAHHEGVPGFLTMHRGRSVMAAPRGSRYDSGQAWIDKVKGKNGEAALLDNMDDADDGHGWGAWPRPIGNEGYTLADLAKAKFHGGVITAIGSGTRGGVIESDLTSIHPNPTIPNTAGTGDLYSDAEARVDSLIERLAVEGPYSLRVTLGTPHHDNGRVILVENHEDDVNFADILNGTWTSGSVNGFGGGIQRSTDATRWGSTKTGNLGDPKRRESVIVWPSTGYTVEYKGGPNSAGEWNHGYYKTGCTSGTETNDPEPDSFENTAARWDDEKNYRICNNDPTAEPGWGGDDTDGIFGYSTMSAWTTGDAGETIIVAKITQVDEDDATFVTHRRAQTFDSDSLLAFVTEDPDTVIAWACSSTYGAIGGVHVSDNINGIAKLKAWDLIPSQYYLFVNGGASPIDSVVVDSSGYAELIVPNQSPTTQIQLLLTAGTPDVTPPDDPANFAANALGPTSIRLTWDAPSETALTVIERDGSPIDSLSAVTYDDTGLTADTEYDYRIRHKDLAGLYSAWSAIVSETTDVDPGDTTSPDAPTGLVAAVIDSATVVVHWDDATDASGIAYYTLQLSVDGGAYSDIYEDIGTAVCAGATPGTEACFRVFATDASANANESAASSPVCVDLPAVTTDVTPPSVPIVGIGTVTVTSIQFTWTASIDAETGVAAYEWREIALDGVTPVDSAVVAVTPRNHTFSGLAPSTTKLFQVKAVNGAGLESAYSAIVGQTSLGDTTPPTVPVNRDFVALGPVSVRFRWFASVEADSPPVTYQAVLMDSTLATLQAGGGTSVLQATWAGLQPSTLYYAQVRALDTVGNASAYSDTISVRTLAISPAGTPMPAGLRYRYLGRTR